MNIKNIKIKTVSTMILIINLTALSSTTFAEEEWTQKADMLSPRVALSSSVVDGKIYAIGGKNRGYGQDRSSAVEQYDPVTDQWTKKANMLIERSNFSTSVVDGIIYAFGGYTGRNATSGPPRSSVEAYDPATDTWTRKTSMPIGEADHSSAAVDGKIYVFGGDTVQIYDPTTDTWSRGADRPSMAKWWAPLSVVDGKIYSIGGAGGGHYGSSWPVLSTVEQYDPATDSWTAKTDIPTATASHVSVVVDGRIYVINGNGVTGTVLSLVQVYDPATDTWTEGPSTTIARQLPSACVVDRTIYLIGGFNPNNDASVTIKIVEALEKEPDYSWMQKTPKRLGSGFIPTIAFSPDGKVIAAPHNTGPSGDIFDTNKVLLWDPQTRQQVGELEISSIEIIVFSPDGKLLAMGNGGTVNIIHLWDLDTQTQLGEIKSPGKYGIQSLAFSPDGTLLASTSSGDSSAHLWDIPSLNHAGALNTTGRSIAFSPDGELLLTGGDRNDARIKLWDVQTRTMAGALVGHLDFTHDLVFSLDGLTLASAGGWEDKAVYLWDVQTEDMVGVLDGHPAHVGSAAFSPDGKLLASTSYWDDTIHIWDVSNQQEIGLLTDHDAGDVGWSDQVAFSSDGRWLACSSDNGIELWEPNLQGTAPQTSAYGPLPRDGATHEDTWAMLSWHPGDYATSHDVYIGGNFDDVKNGIDEVYRGNLTETVFFVGFTGYPYPEGLPPGTTCYWRIDEINDENPSSPWKGPVWSFKIPPYEAHNPIPADGAESVDTNVELSWEAGFEAALHTVYFGENFDDVMNATEGIWQTQTTYTPGPLESGKTYYWRIDESTAGRTGQTYKGDVWSFITISTGDN